jgi:methylated-DNA-[protein]-cysteine S-methyltransferase
MQVRIVRYEVVGWGVGEVWLDGALLVNHELPRGQAPGGRILQSRMDVAMQDPTPPVVERVRAYFRGEKVGFEDVALDLSWATSFQRAVAEALRRIPYGEVVTYGELAALAGHPNAQRAAGSFCAGNRFALVVPCHRVVAAGGIGSYGSLGVDYKRRLLELEGVEL